MYIVALAVLLNDLYTVSKKTKQIRFCQNFLKFPPILIIFGRKMGNDPNICEVHSFSTSPNLHHHLTVLNANVPNCYITPKLLVIDRSHWRPPFKGAGHFGTIRIFGNLYIFDKYSLEFCCYCCRRHLLFH